MSSFNPKITLALLTSIGAGYASSSLSVALATGVAFAVFEMMNYCKQQQPDRKRQVFPMKAPNSDPHSDPYLKSIADENTQIIENGEYRAEGDRILVEKPRPNDTLVIDPRKQDYRRIDEKTQIKIPEDTKIEVLNADCLDTALKLQDKFKSVCLLNMANAFTRGGGYLKGSRAQEEDLCRRTTLFNALGTPEKTIRGWRYNIPEKGCIISRNVQVIRDEAYQLLGRSNWKAFKPPVIDIISAAAYNLNQKMRNNDSRKFQSNISQYEDATKEKIKNILKTAVLTGHDAIVLSAFGCGAFKNDPKTMARLFNEVLQEPVDTSGVNWTIDVRQLIGKRYKDAIKVVFAIKGGDNNFRIFQNQFN